VADFCEDDERSEFCKNRKFLSQKTLHYGISYILLVLYVTVQTVVA
jgi:hypothetical protein